MSVLSNVSKLPVRRREGSVMTWPDNLVMRGSVICDASSVGQHWVVLMRQPGNIYIPWSMMMSTCEYITIVSCLPECNDNIYCVHNCLQSTVNIKISPPWCILQFHNTVTQHPSYFISTRVCLTDWDFFVTFSLYGNQFLIWIWEDWVECLVWRAWQQSDGDSATTISLHFVCLD